MPLHLKISKWHTENDITTCDWCFNQASVAKLLMPSQRLMQELDPENSREPNSLRHEVWGLMEGYQKLMKEKNNDYKTMRLVRLPDILDLYSNFHYITYKEPDWSVVDWGCSCVIICNILLQRKNYEKPNRNLYRRRSCAGIEVASLYDQTLKPGRKDPCF